ncbi:hypothetical protein CYD26_20440 [Pseudomonas sp. FFUP_PS_473]|uniref:hypothetical protein n=1 Tax=Pseudomonas TaxID=286 RepID=UPI000811AAFF|nr:MULTISPECIES: hypothetical protein [Pseudomonas]ATR81209.1 hypothetical protein CS390_00955 [Pseudomonas sp. HLS-6]MBP9961074.1 hypothetical protein [Pseudomonas sp.]MEE3633232.1 hypothetical protein [Pseudomonas sp. AL 58]PLP87855.1 hypothetical protein CYD26_20440 [Pseudomonas sp. FFUP_PS_473]
MSLWDELKQKAVNANPELAAKAAQALNKAKDLAVEAGQKAAPVLKEAGEKAAAYAQEKTPVLKAQALKAIDDAKVRRAELQEQAKHDKAARDEMIRTMYDISLSPEDVNFIDEPFNHYGRQFYFFVVTGQVLDTQKRNQVHLAAGHSHHSSGGYLINGYGSTGSSSSSSYVSSRNVQEHEFWVKLRDGKEACFQFADKAVRIREGQDITMLFVRAAQSQTGEMVALYNHSSAENFIIAAPAEINQMFNIYTVEPGFFNKSEVLSTRNRLLMELERRLQQLCTYSAIHGKAAIQAQAIEGEHEA